MSLAALFARQQQPPPPEWLKEPSVSTYSKTKGRAGENFAKDALGRLGFSRLRRTGSVNYTKDAPDLVQPPSRGIPPRPLRIITTQDNYGPLLVTMSIADLGDLVDAVANQVDLSTLPVVVQCKKRKSTTIGTLWRGLKAATS